MKRINNSGFLQRYFLLLAIAVVGCIFGFSESSFFKPSNLVEIVRGASIIGLMGIGETIVQAAGEMDFTVGGATSFGGVMIAVTMAKWIPNFPLALILTLALVILMGYLNSTLVVRIGIPSFVATLGFNTLLNGINKFLTDGGVFSALHWPAGFSFWGKYSLFGVIPMPAIVFVVCAIIAWIFLSKTKCGRYIYAVGANSSASKNVGISVEKYKTIAYIASALCGGIAGILQCSILNSATPTAGDNNFMTAISTCMLGCTFLTPGVFNIPGTFVGAIMVGMISNGLTMVGASYFMKDIIYGLVLIIALGMVSFTQKRMSKV